MWQSFCILSISNDTLQQNTRMEKHFLEIIGYVAFVDNVFIGRNVIQSTFNVSHYILRGGVPKYNVRETSNNTRTFSNHIWYQMIKSIWKQDKSKINMYVLSIFFIMPLHRWLILLGWTAMKVLFADLL